jgi:hypothetical protein
LWPVVADAEFSVLVGVGVLETVELLAEECEYVDVLDQCFGEHVPVVVVLVLGQVCVVVGEVGPAIADRSFRRAEDEVQCHFFGWAAGLGPVAGGEVVAEVRRRSVRLAGARRRSVAR